MELGRGGYWLAVRLGVRHPKVRLILQQVVLNRLGPLYMKTLGSRYYLHPHLFLRPTQLELVVEWVIRHYNRISYPLPLED